MITDETADQDLLPTPPTPARVAARALVLSAVACRGFIENDAENPAAEDLRLRVWNWLERIEVEPEIGDLERVILQTPLGSMDQRDSVNASWKAEGMVVLAWALGRSKLPVFSTQCEPSEVANSLGFLAPREETALHCPKLTSAKQIEHLAHLYLTLHWRLRQQNLHPGTLNLRDYVASCEWGALTLESLDLIDDDLAMSGMRIDSLDERTLRHTLSVVQERHQALNWVLGFEDVYSQVTTDT